MGLGNRPPSPETLAYVAMIPRHSRKAVAAMLGLTVRHTNRLCRRFLEGQKLLSDLDISRLRLRPKTGRPVKPAPPGRGRPPVVRDAEARRAAAWARIIDPTGALEHIRQNLSLQAARLEAERKALTGRSWGSQNEKAPRR